MFQIVWEMRAKKGFEGDIALDDITISRGKCGGKNLIHVYFKPLFTGMSYQVAS